MAVNKSFLRTAGIGGAFVLGYLMPEMHRFGFLIRYLIMVMLFLVFLRVRPSHRSLHLSHAIVFVVNLALGPLCYVVVRWGGGDHNLALAAFFAGVTPTATAAPVVMGFLGGRVEYVINGFLLTNIGTALALPWLMPFFIGVETPGVTLSICGNLGIVMGLPLLAALGLRLFWPQAEKWPSKLGDFSFSLWLLTLFLIAANASDFLTSNHIGWGILWYLVVTAAICLINFLLGYWIVPCRFRREGSQTLGQKNTTLTIYLALAYANPLVALGPTCYVLWHNLWNAFQLSRVKVNDNEARL